jgi:hypothetical protein
MTFDEKLGSDDICDICYWQDDIISYSEPQIAIGPNKVSLVQAQENYIKFGASEEGLKKYIKFINNNYTKNKQWRVIDLKTDKPTQSSEYYWTN